MLSCGSQYLGSGICRWKHSDGLIGFFFIVGVGLSFLFVYCLTIVKNLTFFFHLLYFFYFYLHFY